MGGRQEVAVDSGPAFTPTPEAQAAVGSTALWRRWKGTIPSSDAHPVRQRDPRRGRPSLVPVELAAGNILFGLVPRRP